MMIHAETVVREDTRAADQQFPFRKGYSVYSPECVRCGWIGRERKVRAQAERDGDKHSCIGETR